MPIERALVAQARPVMLRAKAQAIVKDELDKGCLPDISAEPVALEPRFRPIWDFQELLTDEAQAPAVHEPRTEAGDLRRSQLWISPDQRFDWDRCELFLKHLLAKETTCRERIIAESQKRYYKSATEVHRMIRGRSGNWGHPMVPAPAEPGHGQPEELHYDEFDK